MKIILPIKTPTINHLYWHRGNIKIMKTDAKILRDEINDIVKDIEIDFDITKELKVEVFIYEDWYNQDNSVKKKDIQNREKFLIDSIFKSLNIDDKMIFDCRFVKINSNEEKVIVNIEQLFENKDNLDLKK